MIGERVERGRVTFCCRRSVCEPSEHIAISHNKRHCTAFRGRFCRMYIHDVAQGQQAEYAMDMGYYHNIHHRSFLLLQCRDSADDIDQQ